jgi:hypothetical protein
MIAEVCARCGSPEVAAWLDELLCSRCHRAAILRYEAHERMPQGMPEEPFPAHQEALNLDPGPIGPARFRNAGGRPREHVDGAARQRSYRLRRRHP